MKTTLLTNFVISLVVIAGSLCNVANAQTDTTMTVKTDTIAAQQGEEKKEKAKRKDEFIVFAGVNINQLMVSSSQYESASRLGFQLGGAYKRGKFFYWQVGARFNYAQYNLRNVNSPSDSADNVGVPNIDIPITGGINFLSFASRIVGLRLFISAVPSFALGVSDNTLNITKDDVNTFVFYGQGGIGVNVAFLLLEAGYNYGFQDLLKNDTESRPGQVFINLGFRF